MGMARIVNVGAKDFDFKMYMSSKALDNNSSITFNDMIQDQEGRLWAISLNRSYGLTRYDPHKDDFILNLEKSPEIGWEEGRLLSGFVGKDNILWLGTERYGLLKIDLEQKLFKTLKLRQHQQPTMVSNNIYSISAGIDQNLWIGTANGVAWYDPQTNELAHYNRSNSQMNGNVVFSTLVDSRGYLWLGHNPDQLSRIDTKTWDNQPFKYVINGDTTGFYAWTISDIKEDHQANIWVATHSGGIYECIKGEREFNRYLFKRDDQQIRLTANTIQFSEDQKFMGRDHFWIILP